MRQATVEIDWKVSHSTDVIRQDLLIMIQPDGETSPREHSVTSLPPNQDTFKFKVEEKTKVFVKITAFDGTFFSKPMVNQFYIDDLTAPCSPINEGWKILELDPETPCY